jgi:hypothetical protein
MIERKGSRQEADEEEIQALSHKEKRAQQTKLLLSSL